MRCALAVPALLSAAVLWAGLAPAEEAGDPLSTLEANAEICAADPDSQACALAVASEPALMAAVIAEAGNSRDRAAYIDLIRRFLVDEAPEIRTSAFYALAKLQPDSTDTPAILAALFDPVSNVRAGAWAAAYGSFDPAAQAVIRRVQIRPSGRGYGADPEPFDPAALGVPIPEGAEYLWLTEGLQEEGQLQFLTDATPAEVLAAFAPLAAGPAVAPGEAYDAYPDANFIFGDFTVPSLYETPQVLVVPATEARTARMIAVYRDIVFGRTGFSIVQEYRSGIARPVVTAEEPEPAMPSDPAVLASAMARWSGIDPSAPTEESDLYAAIIASDGFGAEDYLEVYPDGAYAEEMRAILAGPRLVLDDVTYADTGTIAVSFRNLPAGVGALIQILDPADDLSLKANALVEDVAAGETVLTLGGRIAPGRYLMEATVDLPESELDLTLYRDFSVVLAPVELALSKTAFAPGEAITVRFAGMSGDAKDYLATAPAESPGSTYRTYVYTDGLIEGTVSLAAPAEAGEYELRAFFRNDDSLIRGSVPFTVTAAATPEKTVAPAVDKAPEDNSTPTATSVPAASGVVLTMEKPVLGPGEPIRLTFAGLSGDGRDFIATAPAGSPPESYLKYTYSNGVREGSATLVAPEREGSYELRAVFASDAKTIQAMLPFEVRADVRLELEKTVFAPGESIRFTFSGLAGSSQDYISTAPAGSAPEIYVTYVYASGARDGSLSLKAPDQPGDYELRAFLQYSPEEVKAVLPFSVSGGP